MSAVEFIKEHPEFQSVILTYAFGWLFTYGDDSMFVVSASDEEHDDLCAEYKAAGYRFCDENMFGKGDSRYTAICFKKIRKL